MHGVGVNDADYNVYKYKNGKCIWRCPTYSIWCDMIRRCYSEKSLKKHVTYEKCEVCEHWKIFSNFKTWVDSQEPKGKELDKDILKAGNNIYCPEYCVFIPKHINVFLNSRGRDRGQWPLGVHMNKKLNKFTASCSIRGGKRKILGLFTCPNEAHEAWRKYKHQLACQYADEQTDPRIAHALRTRFSYEEWYKDKDDKQ